MLPTHQLNTFLVIACLAPSLTKYFGDEQHPEHQIDGLLPLTLKAQDFQGISEVQCPVYGFEGP